MFDTLQEKNRIEDGGKGSRILIQIYVSSFPLKSGNKAGSGGGD